MRDPLITRDMNLIAWIALALAGAGCARSVAVQNSGSANPGANSVETLPPVPPPARQFEASVPATPIPISACQDIGTSGYYQLTADLGPGLSGTPCLNIHSVTGIQLDCAGHTVSGSQSLPAVMVTSVGNFSIQNCDLARTDALSGMDLQITASNNGEISANTFGNGNPVTGAGDFIEIDQSTQVSVHDNTFNGKYLQHNSSGISVINNVFNCFATLSGAYCDALINSDQSTGDEFSGNTINGNAGIDASIFSPGSDDGIVITDSTGDVVSANTITNTWDEGIEFVGLVQDLTITGNSIHNASNGGIGGWYWFGMSNSVMADNAVDGSATAFNFSRAFGLRAANASTGQPADPGIYFMGNLFSSNIFTNPYSSAGSSVFLPISNNMDFDGTLSSQPGETNPSPSQYFLTGNIFTDNSFGVPPVNLGTGPFPSGMVIDGGGNSCVASDWPGFPLNCGENSVATMTLNGVADGAVGSVTYVTLKGRNLSLDSKGAPGAYLVNSPDCTIVPGQTYSYDGQDPSWTDPSYRQINLAIDNSKRSTAFSCTFLVTRDGDQRVKSVWTPGLAPGASIGSPSLPSLVGIADGPDGAVSYVTLRGQYLSLTPTTNPGAYTVASPNCMIVPGQAYSYDGPDPSYPGDPTRRQINLAISADQQSGNFNCTFIVTRGPGDTLTALVRGIQP